MYLFWLNAYLGRYSTGFLRMSLVANVNVAFFWQQVVSRRPAQSLWARAGRRDCTFVPVAKKRLLLATLTSRLRSVVAAETLEKGIGS